MFENIFVFAKMNFVWDSGEENYFYNVLTQFGKSIKQDSKQAKSSRKFIKGLLDAIFSSGL